MESINSLDNLEEPPGDIQAAIVDPRTFYLRRDGDAYEADVTNFGEAQEDQEREHLVVNTAPDFIHRSDVDQAMTIGGLISCVAVIIEAGNDAGTQLLIGMHFTTGYHTGQDDALNARGASALQAMQLLSDGFQITRVHLCHPLQFNAFNLQGRVHENTTTNLDALRAFFGNGICQTHVLGQTQVTAQLGTDGEVAIDV